MPMPGPISRTARPVRARVREPGGDPRRESVGDRRTVVGCAADLGDHHAAHGRLEAAEAEIEAVAEPGARQGPAGGAGGPGGAPAGRGAGGGGPPEGPPRVAGP